MKITARLVLLFGLCIGFIYIVFSVYVTNSYTDILEKEVRETVDNMAEKTSLHIISHQHNTKELLEGAAIYFRESNLKKRDLEQALKRIVSKENANVVGSAFAYNTDIRREAPYCWRQGDSLHFTDIAQEYDYWNKEWYTKVSEDNPVYWSRPYVDFGIPMITCSRRVRFADNTFKGVLTVDISLASLNRFMKKLGGEKAFVFVLHEESDKIISSVTLDGKMTYSDSVYIRAIETSWKRLPQDTLAGQLKKIHYYDQQSKKNYYIVFSHLPETNWTAGALFEEEKVFAEINGVVYKSRWMLLGGFILISLIIVLLAKSITKPLRQLTDAAKQIGEGKLGVAFPRNQKGKSEIAILSRTLQEMQNNLIRQIQLLETTISQKQKIESELQIAHDMQQAMLPSTELPCKMYLDIFACLESAKEVGGDLYDFFMIDEKRLCLVVGDVAGKGVPAALYMAITNSYIKAFSKEDFSPASILTHTNTQLSENNEICMFVTLFCCVIDITTGVCCYANAGHNPPFIITPSGEIVKIEQEPQPALGAFDSITYQEYCTKIAQGEMLVLYTDGITEAMNASKEEFGEPRLIETLTGAEKETCKQLGTKIMKQVEVFIDKEPPSDDKTLLIFKLEVRNE